MWNTWRERPTVTNSSQPSLHSAPHTCRVTPPDTKPVQLSALLDSGADESFIDKSVVERLGIETQALDIPLGVRALNGVCLDLVEMKTVPLDLRLSGNHQESVSFHIIDSPHTPLVLGYPWFHKHNPHIDWPTGSFSAWSTYCHSHCLRSAPTPSTSATLPLPEPPDLSSVPAVYHDLELVFSKHQALSLPPHRPYDCAINLLPGAPLPSSCLYNLSRPERESMENYIQDSLAAGLICPSSSPVGAGFFFVKKRDGTLRPCIDYRGLNTITVKDKYPLPLIDSAFVPLREASVFSKLDLRNAYHLVRVHPGDEWKTAFNQCCSRVTMPRVRVQARVSSVRVRVKSKSLKKNLSRVRVESTTHTSRVPIVPHRVRVESESESSPSRLRVSTKAYMLLHFKKT